MLKVTLNSSLRLLRSKNLHSDGDELSVVYCTFSGSVCMLCYFITQNLKNMFFVIKRNQKRIQNNGSFCNVKLIDNQGCSWWWLVHLLITGFKPRFHRSKAIGDSDRNVAKK